MFKSLKIKLKEKILNFSKKAEEEAEEEEVSIEEVKEAIKEKVEEESKKKRGIFSIFKKPKKEAIAKEETKLEIIKQSTLTENGGSKKIKEEVEKEEKKLGIFGKFKEKVVTKKITEDKFNELFEELELILLGSNVAFEVVEKLKEDLRNNLVNKPILRKEIGDIIKRSLKDSLKEILIPEKEIDLEKEIKKSEKPYIILLLGYNGAGKTLTCARLAYYLKEKGFKSMLSAGDTFRAAGATQLAELAKKINVPVIIGQIGADSCSVVFDTISSAKAKNYDVVIADTAGRIHSNKDLLRELEKIVRVNKPNLKLLIVDALSGTDVVEQARQFDDSVGVDGFIITKVDSYDKGGAVLSASYVTGKPILFIGNGQQVSNLTKYDGNEVIKNLGF